MAQAIETVSVTVESDDDGTAEFDVPVPLIEFIGDDETAADVVANTAVQQLGDAIHLEVHHDEVTDDEDLIAADEVFMETFEEQLGMTYAESHQH